MAISFFSFVSTALAALLIFSKNDVVEVGNDFSLGKAAILGFGIGNIGMFNPSIEEDLGIVTSPDLNAGADICLDFGCGVLRKITQIK